MDALRALQGPPRVEAASPWAQVLWENCCYLADDERRAQAFSLLEKKTRLDPKRILAASDAVLREVTGHGIVPEKFVEKLRTCARLALDAPGGDLDAALGAMEPAVARRALRRFPGIGEPGAEKILLHARLLATCALDSNGLRVVERLGYVEPDENYARQWKTARRAIAAEAPGEIDGLIELYALLRRHGQTICTRSKPRCTECPLAGGDVDCPFPLKQPSRSGPWR
jgi:endonuclease-3